jgi:benzoyl-CoA reductase subunit D
MFTLGIDVGSLATKSVILNEHKVVAQNSIQSGDDVQSAIREAVNLVLSNTKMQLDQVHNIAFTGIGKDFAPYPGSKIAEGKCGVAGARFFNVKIGGVVDIGAESSRVAKCDDKGRVVGFTSNDRCAAGTGIFLDTMSKLLKIENSDAQALEKVENKVEITATCVVFAESEVVSMIHKGVNRYDLWMGINRSVASRVYTLINKLRLEGQIAIIGGVARNPVLIHCLKEMTGDRLFIPDAPEFANALGVAILAKEADR